MADFNEPVWPNFKQLRQTLVNSRIQVTNKALYQVINQLLNLAAQSQATTQSNLQQIVEGINGNPNNPNGGIANAEYLTWSDQSATLPNSRELVDSLDIAFDDSVAGERAISQKGYWSVLTDGDPVETDLIFADGDVISVHMPIPP